MKHIYLVRHGETNANKLQYVPGKDEPLNEVGFLQAEQLSERVKNLDIDSILVSDYVRTQQTVAPVVKQKQIPFEVVPHIHEQWEGISFVGVSETDEKFLEFRKDRALNYLDLDWRFEDAENMSDIFERTLRTREYFEKTDKENILVVSHAMFLRYFLASVLLDAQTPTSEWIHIAKHLKIANTGISLVTIDEAKWKVVMINDHARFAE